MGPRSPGHPDRARQRHEAGSELPEDARGPGNWHPGCSRLAPRTGEIPNPGTHTNTKIPGCDGLAPGVHRLLITARMRKSRLGDLGIRSRQLQTGGGGAAGEGPQERSNKTTARRPTKNQGPGHRFQRRGDDLQSGVCCGLQGPRYRVGSGFRGFVFGVVGFRVSALGFQVSGLPRNPNSKPRSRNPEPYDPKPSKPKLRHRRAWAGCFGLSGRLRGKVRQGHSCSGAKRGALKLRGAVEV